MTGIACVNCVLPEAIAEHILIAVEHNLIKNKLKFSSYALFKSGVRANSNAIRVISMVDKGSVRSRFAAFSLLKCSILNRNVINKS